MCRPFKFLAQISLFQFLNGAIGCYMQGLPRMFTRNFNSLMVRLDERLLPLLNTEVVDFNSLMVRLDACFAHSFGVYIPHFNSLMVRLDAEVNDGWFFFLEFQFLNGAIGWLIVGYIINNFFWFQFLNGAIGCSFAGVLKSLTAYFNSLMVRLDDQDKYSYY